MIDFNEEKILTKIRNSLINLDIDGMKKFSKLAIAKEISPVKVVSEGMGKGMEIVGEKYAEGEYFLAELIMAGETMKEGMAILSPYLKSGDIESKGKILVGTAKGDLHDIGKNVLITLLEGAGFSVVDLGIDVDSQKFEQAIRDEQPDIVAMSALLTTTMVEMKTVIETIVKEGLREKVKIIIGGAPITEQFAKQIGADSSANDAVEGVNICKKWMKK